MVPLAGGQRRGQRLVQSKNPGYCRLPLDVCSGKQIVLIHLLSWRGISKLLFSNFINCVNDLLEYV